jgi:hypothetical protein
LKKFFILTISFTLFLTIISAAPSNFRQQIYEITECNDGIDNDGDGGIDFASDPQCLSWEDNSELIDETPPPDPEPEPPASNPVDNGNNPPPNSGGTPGEEGPTEEPGAGSPEVLFQEFLWEPIGKVFGLDIAKLEQGKYNRNFTISAFILVYFLLILIMLLILLKRRHDRNQEEST